MQGCYPLHIACSNGCKPTVIQFLIKKYPQAIWETVVNNRTPMFHACKNYVLKSKKVCKTIANRHLHKVLEILGSLAPMSFMTKDKCEKTPLDYVIETEAHPIVVDHVHSISANLRRETIRSDKNKQKNWHQPCMLVCSKCRGNPTLELHEFCH